MNLSDQENNNHSPQVVEIAIRVSLIFLIMAWCLMILAPFVMVILWSGVVAIAVYPAYMRLTAKVGGRKGIAVGILSIAGFTVIALPVILLSGSMIDGAVAIGTQFDNGSISIPPPSDSVKQWPLIGEWAHAFWQQASGDVTAILKTYAGQLTGLGKSLLSFAAGLGLGMVQFFIALAVAPVLLLHAQTVNESLVKLARRLSGDHGQDILQLSEKTVRSVAVGVMGIAFIQAFFAGIGMLIAGVPAAGLLAIVALILGIAQLSPQFVLIPVVIYLFSLDSTGMAVFFLIWSALIAASDLVLKPLLLGRGVGVPLLIILTGALGGMLMSGIVGLFTGAVVLAVGYKLLQAFINEDVPDSP